MEKSKHFMSLIEGDLKARHPNIERHRVYRALYFDDGIRELEYPGQADIHIPLITEKVEIITPKVMNAFWQATPHVHAQRIGDEATPEATKRVERFLNWAIDTDIPRLYATFQMWVRNALLDGVAVVMPYYRRKYRNIVDEHIIKNYWMTGEIDYAGFEVPEPRAKLPEDLLVDVTGDPNPTIQEINEKNNTYVITFRDGGEVYSDVPVVFEPADRDDEVRVCVYRPFLERENVEVDLLEFEDLIVPYRTRDLQEAERVTRQCWLTYDEVLERVEDDGWDLDDDDLEILKAGISGVTQEEHLENRELKRQKDSIIGESDGHPDSPRKESEKWTPQPYVKNKVLVWEIYCKDDIDGDGRAEEAIHTLVVGAKKIVHSEYLEKRYPHAHRPFIDLHYARVSDRFYSVSLAAQLASLNIEADAIVNGVNESQELINHPFGVYEPAATTADPKVFEDLPRGKLIPVADVTKIAFPHLPQQPLANLSALDSVLLWADRLTVPPQAGGSNQSRNAPRTARGTLALLSESAVKTDMFITDAQEGPWRELIHQFHALYHHFGPEEKWFHVTGQPRSERITNEDLRGRYVYTFSGNTVNTNREIKRTLEQVLYNTLMANPLVLNDPNALQALTERFIRAFGEGTDMDRLIPKSLTQGGPHPPMSQEAEIQVMLQGGAIDALSMDDHATHMAVIDRFRRTTEFNDMDTWKVSLIAQHYTQHARLLMQSVQQGSMQAGAGGPGNNVPLGMTLAQGDLENLEGGIQ